jgi:phosphoglycerol transferase MdoB-like AlkP superfamily enzyme
MLFFALLFFFFRAVFLLTYMDFFSDLEFSQVLFAFVDGARFDLSIALTFAAFPLLFIAFPSRLAGRKWVRFWTFVILLLSLIYAAVLAGDIIYFDYVKRHISNELLLVVDDIGFLKDMLLGEYLYLIPLFLIALYFLNSLSKRVVGTIDYEQRSITKFILLFLLLFIAVRGTFSDKPINVIDAFNSGNAKQGNLTLNGCFTAYHYTRKSGKFSVKQYYSNEELEAILNVADRPNPEYPYEKEAKPGGKQRNVVFILMESWSAKYIDAVSHGGYGVTPNFDALAKEGRLFTNFFASGQRSIQGIQATLTSIPPFTGLPSIGRGLEVYNISKVADMANRSGYETLFVQSSKRRSFRIDAIADALGFEQFYGMEDIPMKLAYKDQTASKFGWDYETYMFLKSKLDTLKEPFFSYMFTGTTHVPYADLPDRFHKYPHESNGEKGFLNTLYYSDWSLGEFMKAAKTAPWYNNTVFIFTADHTLSVSRGDTMLDRFHIPLLIYIPGEKGHLDTRTASHLDLMPTIVDMIGYEGPYSAFGSTLLNGAETTALVNEANSIGLIKQDGYVQHSLKRILDTNCSRAKRADYEAELLANYQLINMLLKVNRWAR